MLLIASCSTDIDVISPELDTTMVDISVVAESNDETRLLLDGNRTEWEVGDRITLAQRQSTTPSRLAPRATSRMMAKEHASRVA